MNEQNVSQEEQKDQSMFLKPILMIVVTIVVVGGWAMYLQKKADTNKPIIENEQENEQEDQQANIIGSMPNFSLSDTLGNMVSLTDVANQKKMLTFWHLSCGWCTKQLPELYVIAENNPDIEFLAVNVGDKVEDITELLTGKPANVKILMDSDFAVANDYEVQGTPAHFILDENSDLVETVSGYRSVADFQTILDGAF